MNKDIDKTITVINNPIFKLFVYLVFLIAVIVVRVIFNIGQQKVSGTYFGFVPAAFPVLFTTNFKSVSGFLIGVVVPLILAASVAFL